MASFVHLDDFVGELLVRTKKRHVSASAKVLIEA
jgi:hypothetical protein